MKKEWWENISEENALIVLDGAERKYCRALKIWGKIKFVRYFEKSTTYLVDISEANSTILDSETIYEGD